MLNRIAELFTPRKELESPAEQEERFRIATCVVLLEAARADEEFTDGERELIVRLLSERFSLSEADAHELIEASTVSRRESVDLWSFTNQINEACSLDEKKAIIEEVWRVMYADGNLDGHEDYLIHRLAKLLNLAHKELIEAKMKVLEEGRGGG